MKASNIFFGAVGVCFFTSTTLASNVPDGDIVTFSPNATAKAAEVNQNFTKLKEANNDNNSKIEILQTTAKPGVEFNEQVDANMSFTSGFSNYLNIALDAPATGYALVTFSAHCNIYHVTASQTYLQFGINTTPNADATNNASFRWIVLPSVLPSSGGAYVYPVVTQLVQAVAAGTTTFYVDASAAGGSGFAATCYRGSLNAMYLPSRY